MVVRSPEAPRHFRCVGIGAGPANLSLASLDLVSLSTPASAFSYLPLDDSPLTTDYFSPGYSGYSGYSAVTTTSTQ